LSPVVQSNYLLYAYWVLFISQVYLLLKFEARTFENEKHKVFLYWTSPADRLAGEATQNCNIKYSRIPKRAIKKTPEKKV
jgi:hypothetical protein